MLIVYDDVLHRLKRDVYYVVDVVEALVSFAFAHGLLQVKSQISDRPFWAVPVVIVVVELGDGNVGQMDEHVISFVHVIRVFGDAKARKP